MTTRRKRLIASLVTLFYIAGVIMAIEAIVKARTSQGAIAWSVSLVSFPFVSVPAYLVFGRSKFAGMSEVFEERKEEFEKGLKNIQKELDPFEVSPKDGPSWHEALVNLSKQNLTKHNKVDLLINGDETFDSIEQGILQAKDYILFQFYIIKDDKLGRRLKDALVQKAEEGVRVFVLYDEIGSHSLSNRYIKDLKEAGAEVSAFGTTQGRRNRFQLNFRNHRKIVVVDGQVGWVGGLNVGDDYMGLYPKFSPWRDTHSRIEGPAVIQLQMVMLADWYWATRSMPQVSWKPRVPKHADQLAMIFPFAPTGDMESASLFFVTLLNAAEKRIWLSAPYFVPDEAVMKALQLASLRGVDVRILLNSVSDNFAVYYAAFNYIEELSNANIQFYFYKPGFLHEKVVLVDDRISTVGTPNFDNRSFRLNFEISALVVDQDFNKKMEDMFLKDFSTSEKFQSETLNDKPYWWWALVRLCRLLSPIL